MESKKVYFSAAARDAVNDATFEDVPVPEWGPDMVLRMRNMTALQRGLFVERAARLAGKKAEDGEVLPVDAETTKQTREIEIFLVRLCACDEAGKPIFTEADSEWLGQRNGAVIGRLAEVAQRLSGMSKAEKDENLKNLKPAANEGSSTV